jgi:hypothetical protein
MGMDPGAIETNALAGRFRRRGSTHRALTLGMFIAMLATALGWFGTEIVQGATFSASLDHTTVFANEEVTLSLVVQDGRADSWPVPPPVPGLQFRAAGETSHVTLINNRRSSAMVYSYTVQAAQPGDYVIPPIKVLVAGRELTSQPLRLKVESGELAVEEGVAFLRLVAPRTDLFVGEVLLLEVRLYATSGTLRGAPQLQAEGLTFGPMIQTPTRSVRVGNQFYSLVVFNTYVSPARSGQLQLGPATVPMSLPNPRSRRDIFGRPRDFMDVSLSSPTLELNVAPLPNEGRPTDFNGAVGDYSLAVSVSTNRVTAGDPITIVVQIAGGGPLEPLKLDSFNHWSGFKTYPPATQVQTNDTFGLEGVKTFEQVVIPESAAVRELPPITFSYFNPVTRSYQTLSHPPTPLVVQPAPASVARPIALGNRPADEDPPHLGPDLVHIKTRLGHYGAIQPPLLARPWFIALQGLPVLAWLTAFGWRKRIEHLANNPRLRRRHDVSRRIARGLHELKQQAARNDRQAFFATVFRLLQERLGEKLDRPASAITEDVLDDQLGSLRLGPATLKELRETFQTCNQTRFSPDTIDGDLASFVPRVTRLLEELDKAASRGSP